MVTKMNIAIIIAGGSGQRVGQDIPKQFINVYDKPILIYTLEGFQKHPQIDEIGLVCLNGWHDVVRAYAKQFNIDKLKLPLEYRLITFAELENVEKGRQWMFLDNETHSVTFI